MIPIHIDPALRNKCPHLVLGCVYSRVMVAPSAPPLLALMENRAAETAALLDIESISGLPRVRATREAYKALGKKPGRYRPSAEALLRRVVGGKGLYHINNVVDLLNYLSITTHYSIGGYDAGRIDGEPALGVGREGEPYEAIARGELNIAGLPVFRDARGAFGTPTSDSERTCVRPETRDLLMVFFDFGDGPGPGAACRDAVDLLAEHAGGAAGEWWLVE